MAARNFMSRARAAEERSSLRQAQYKRQVSRRRAMRILEARQRESSARQIQVRHPCVPISPLGH